MLDAVPDRAGTVVVCNGRIVHTQLDPALAARGVALGALADLDPDGAALGAVLREPTDVFSLLNDAFSAEPVLLRVPAGVEVDRPVVVAHWVESAGLVVLPRLVVQAGPDSGVTVLDHQGSADVASLVLPVVELHAGPAARVRYVAAQELGMRVWQIASQVARAERDATLRTATVALGGDYARLRSDAHLVGKGATGDQVAVYFGEGGQMHDFRTLQDHAAPNTSSDLLFKGAVEGHAKSVYSGLIRVRKEAPGTTAHQTNRNIKLSEGAWAESVPNLEIENNDVRCSHASAVGPIDEDQRFYLESRGVPTEVAERLIVTGFFDEVLLALPVPGIVDGLRRRVAEKLARRDG
ncbi:MAG: SufD family Fe-S cluster assembly protein [Acidimicrobiales bacterium]|nr:SufD family Fe-S cluster assembly protein [Acidimicrobiales bacterium]